MNSIGLALWMGIALQTAVAAQPADQEAPATNQAAPKKAPDPKETTLEKKEALSDADRIIRLQKQLDTDEKNLEKTKMELADPRSDYHQAEDAFKNAEKSLDQKKAELKKLKAQNPQADTAKFDNDIRFLAEQRGLARDRFDVAIKENKNLQERAALLTVKIAKTRQAIALLQGASPQTTPEMGPPQGGAAAPVKPPAAAQKSSSPAHPPSMELQKALKEAALKDAEDKNAKEKLKSIDDHMTFLAKNIELDKQIVQTLERKATNAAELRASLQKELEQKRAAKVPEPDLAPLVAKLADAEKQVASSGKDLSDMRAHLKDLDGSAKKMRDDERVAKEAVDQTGKAVEEADRKVKFLESPWAPRNLVLWLWEHVPAIAVVIVAMVLLQWLVRVASRRIVQWMVCQHFRGTQADRENRADTLVGVFRNTASFVILVGGTLMILQGLGIPIMPLLGGAAAGGLAVAFGAQNIIKDYLSGFMVLLEDQYGINDVVKIAGVSGQVETITLRLTVLRDNEGTVHFIPHSVMTTVSNMTHRWARAFFEICIAYKEDLDRVMEILLQLCQELRADPAFGRFILDDPEMLGVDHLGENGIAIQFLLRTSPLKQWPVKRELLRRIKNRFDELGIDLPHQDFASGACVAAGGNGKAESVPSMKK